VTPIFQLKNKKKFNNVEIKHTLDIPLQQVQKLYLSVGWQYRDIKTIEESFKKSILVTTAWIGNDLVGIARATGDGIFNATIWDVAVRKDCQGQGIGTKLINSMLTKLDDCGIPLITLYTTYTKKNFYSKLGFEFNINKVMGMYRIKK